MAPALPLSSIPGPDEPWPLWVRLLIAMAAAALALGGVIASVRADQAGSLALGLVATAAGILLLAQVPGPDGG